MRSLRVSNFQWASGILNAFLGTLMLIAPHQFYFLSGSPLEKHLLIWGTAFLLSGCALVCIPVIVPNRLITVLTHLTGGFLLLFLSASFAQYHAWVSALNFGVIGVGLLLALFLPRTYRAIHTRRDARGFPVYGDLFTFLVGVGTVLTSLVLLSRHPSLSLNPVFRFDPQTELIFGILFGVSGLLLSVLQLPQVNNTPWAIKNRPWLLRGSHTFTGLVFLAFLIVASLPMRIWVGTAYFGGCGIILLVKPWLSPLMRAARPLSLESRFILILAITAALPLILTTSWISEKEEQTVISESLENQERTAQALSQNVGYALQLYQATLFALRNQPELRSPDAEIRQQALDQFEEVYPTVTSFTLYDDSGTPLNSTHPNFLNQSLHGQPHFEQAQQSGLPGVDILVVPGFTDPLLVLSAPLFDDQSRFSGMVTVSVSTRLIAPLLEAGTGKSSALQVYLVDETGRAILSTAPNATGGPLTSLKHLAPVTALLSGYQPGAFQYESPHGEMLAGYARISGLGWGVVVERDLAGALMGIYYERDMVFGYLLMFLVLTSLFGVFLAGRLTAPLRALSHAAEEMANGNMHVPLPHSSFLEVDSLTRSFGTTRQALAERTAEREIALEALRGANEALEMRVAERTAELAEDRARLNAIFQAAPEGIIVTDNQARIRYINPVAERLYARPIPIGEDYHTHVNFQLCRLDGTPYQPEEMPLTRSALFGETSSNLEMFVIWPDGQRRQLLVNTAPIRDQDGCITGAIGVFQDITERKRMEEEFHSQRALLQAIFEADPSALAIVVQDEDGPRIEMSNPAYTAITPHPEMDPRGRLYCEVWPPEEGFGSTEIVEPALQAGHSIAINRLVHTYPDGTNRYFTIHAKPIVWGSHPAALLVAWETTFIEQAQKRAEEAALEASRRAAEVEASIERLNFVLNSLANAYFMLDERWRFMEINPIAEKVFFHRPASRLIGRSIWEEFPTLVETGFCQHLNHAMTRNLPVHFEMKGLNGDSWFEVHAYPRDKHLELYLSNITDRKQTEVALLEYAAKLERSNQDLADFAFIASHDLLEPLRKIQAFGERLKSRYATELPEEARDWVGRMQNASSRMQSMLNDLLSYSRVNTRAEPLRQIDLNCIARGVLNDLEIRIERSAGRVEVGELPEIEADPLQMRQLFQNLIGNALKFNRPGVPPVVKVTAQPIGENQVEIRVEDNGIGFNIANINRIFQPFQRLHGRSEYEGNGMGLAICRKITERHQGTITAHSVEGEGTTFIITLPIRQEREKG